MTRDEVMAMTDDELRIKALELLGWPSMTGAGTLFTVVLWFALLNGDEDETTD